MGIVLPGSTKVGELYYYRVRVPKDVRDNVRGTLISIALDEEIKTVQVGDAVKVSLQTRDPALAKLRFQNVQAQFNERWEAVRNGPKRLSHKQCLALAGEIYRPWVEVLDENPGSPKMWERVIELNEDALQPKMSPFAELAIRPLAPSNLIGLEKRFGSFVDIALRKRDVLVDKATRERLLQMIATAMSDAARVNL